MKAGHFGGLPSSRSHHASPLNHTDQHHNDGQHQQQVNEATQRLGTHHPERP